MLAFDKPRSEYQLVTQLALQLLDYVIDNQGGIDTEALLGAHVVHNRDELSNVHELIKILVAQCPAVFVFIDGLDEVVSGEKHESQSQQGKEPDKLKQHLYLTLSFLNGLARIVDGTPLRLWCSSRKTDSIRKWMQDFGAVELAVNEHLISVDVTSYLDHHTKLETDSTSIKMDAMRNLRRTMGCNFLLASLVGGGSRGYGLSTKSTDETLLFRTPSDVHELYRQRLDQLGRIGDGDRIDSQEQLVSSL